MLARIPLRAALLIAMVALTAFGLVLDARPADPEPYRPSGITPQYERSVLTKDGTPEATIVVAKRTIPAGAPDLFTFTGDASGEIADGQQLVEAVRAGFYASAEDATSEWNLISILCDDTNSVGDLDIRSAIFAVAAAETVTCTFTNAHEDVRHVDGFDTGDTAVWSTAIGAPGPLCAHSLCETGVALNRACSSCVAQVCDSDPACCVVTWDSACVNAAAACGATCIP